MARPTKTSPTPSLSPRAKLTDVLLTTERLILRQWREEDRAPWAAMNADPEVMRHFPGTQSRAESDDFIDRRAAEIASEGYGFFALEEKSSGEFLGMTGLTWPGFEGPFKPAMEVGWRLARAHWGKGFASEAASACLIFAKEALSQQEIISFTAASNTRSMAVMERIGMTRVEDGNFMHPKVDPASPIALHVLYRINL
ncbi:MAG: N-acetyltransferase [Alphaproteobacteria bacterium]|nr:MAG: N-acetyltransferase [Alphaproteobacteria bacterium]